MDDYDRIRELGRGSFGAAILVRRKTDQKQLVVKEVNLGSLSQKEIAEARKEANFLANLSHPNIVRYEGCLEKEKKLMIFMEFCEGGDLSEKIKKQNGVLFTEEIILDWFCQECFFQNVLFPSQVQTYFCNLRWCPKYEFNIFSSVRNKTLIHF